MPNKVRGTIWNSLATLSILLVLVVGCSAASSDTTSAAKKKVKEVKMKNSDAKSVNPNDVPVSAADTTHGAQGDLNSVDILTSSSSKAGKQSDTEKSFRDLSEEKQLDSFNEYSKLHKEPPIGDATMDKEGTIRVRIRMMGGMNADGGVTYKKDSEHYDSILKHLGGMKPGDIKLVPPWPDEEPKEKNKR